MTPIQRAPLRAALLVIALLAAFQLSAGAPRLHAGGTSFFIAYGAGLEPGATVGILIGDNFCGEVAVDAAGEWVATIGPDAPALVCAAAAGDLIHFKLNGVLTEVTEVFASGGTPAEPVFGVALAGSDAGADADVDTVPPVIEGPEVIEHVVATADDLIVIDLSDFVAVDAVDGAVDLLNDAPGEGFPVGTSWIRFTAVDAAGNEAVLEVKVIVTVKVATDGGIAGDEPVEGVGFGNAIAGPITTFREALIEQGVKSVWVIFEGEFVIFYPESPDFVSTQFLELYADGIPEGEPMLIWAK